ncbi:MAG TPA: tetrahydromethanopterin S-methyltransferase subunit A [Candidatus Nitrosotalea sp.]|nr:tetrahydromethanopterin S-methyltransferase subunit A [Candidatus Nitrosotalea sp.]
MNFLEEIAGEVCKILLPIDDKVYLGNPDSCLAVCTLSSMALLEELATSSLMSHINVAGRLLSENRGIETLVRNVLANGKIRKILLCGREVQGHRTGHSLVCLHQNGLDRVGRILGSKSPDPVLTLTDSEVSRFQASVGIIDRTGETNLSRLGQEIFRTAQ